MARAEWREKIKMEQKTFELDLEGQKIKVEINALAEQANGAVLVTYGETVVLATAVIKEKAGEGKDYFPLMVDYEEKHYAAGRIIGSRFFKRETRPTEEAVLVARLIDRTLRPLFDRSIRNDVQVIITVLSLDDKNDPDVPSMLASSLAILTSNIPWSGPIAGVRVGHVNGGFRVNPTFEEREQNGLDLVVAGTENRINMMEGGCDQIPEEEILRAIEFADRYIKILIEFQKNIAGKIKPQKLELAVRKEDEDLRKKVLGILGTRLENALFKSSEKHGRMNHLNDLAGELFSTILQAHPDKPEKAKEAAHIYEDLVDEIVHQKAIEEDKRVDGRKMDELRALEAHVGLLPRTHGSGLFKRGQTTALSVLTLGAPSDAQLVEGMEIVGKKRFMHHYNFPPYSVGEVGPMRGPGRREIGHGALAERSLKSIIPPADEFPYTIRLVSEILSSNGSSSMASVSGSTLALMDGGVPIKEPAAGIAMGLMMKDENTYKVLTDIQGPEDHHGDMDLKVAGTKNGITGIQMDVKIEGVTTKILEDVFSQARKARLEILETITKTIAKPREQLSRFAPRILMIQIDPAKIRSVIGTGGKVINGIIAETLAQIDIEDDGTIFITAETDESAKQAVERIKNITREFEIGEKVEGKVVRITDFGAFVELAPGRDGMVHISELAPRRIERVEDILHMGDVRTFKIVKIDEQGKIGLSIRALEGPGNRRAPEKKRYSHLDDLIERS